LAGEYFEMLAKASPHPSGRKVILFLGDNIGNMEWNEIERFCEQLNQSLTAGDMVVIGFDLRKNPHTILNAYNDRAGITAAFNLNILTRLNTELGADFDLEQFQHYQTYDPISGACRSYLVSLTNQNVAIGDVVISLSEDELINVEVSQKFSKDEISGLAERSGFILLSNTEDSKGWFVDSAWQVKGKHATEASSLVKRYQTIRNHSADLCAPLQTEDYVVQPIADVSPPKWHLGHTTWFFETFILVPNFPGYKVFDPQYNFVFNSYYETIGARVIRTDRGNLSRPSVADVYAYREYVDQQMYAFFKSGLLDETLGSLLELGLNHEQQHQELLHTDIKYILGHNPLFPAYQAGHRSRKYDTGSTEPVKITAGLYEIGHKGDGFCFDNELNRHKVYLYEFDISSRLVTNAEYLQFIESGGYTDFRHWHAEGWDWVKDSAKMPLYWHFVGGKWMNYTFAGLQHLDLNEPVCHVNFYEASAYAAWKGMRLPMEAEWEVASDHLNWGQRWEWTNSAYLPYPGFKKEAGAVGEYNGKFMLNQMVLRGASEATPVGHSRNTYRNFFHAKHQWQLTGIRLVSSE
jgi:ergothioneine biosynthesis protein EgtB